MIENSCNEAMFNFSTAKTCYCHGNTDHVAANCKFKTAKCNVCRKIDHLVRVCNAKTKHKLVIRGDTKQSKVDATKAKNEMHQFETLYTEISSNGTTCMLYCKQEILQLNS